MMGGEGTTTTTTSTSVFDSIDREFASNGNAVDELLDSFQFTDIDKDHSKLAETLRQFEDGGSGDPHLLLRNLSTCDLNLLDLSQKEESLLDLLKDEVKDYIERSEGRFKGIEVDDDSSDEDNDSDSNGDDRRINEINQQFMEISERQMKSIMDGSLRGELKGMDISLRSLKAIDNYDTSLRGSLEAMDASLRELKAIGDADDDDDSSCCVNEMSELRFKDIEDDDDDDSNADDNDADAKERKLKEIQEYINNDDDDADDDDDDKTAIIAPARTVTAGSTQSTASNAEAPVADVSEKTNNNVKASTNQPVPSETTLSRHETYDTAWIPDSICDTVLTEDMSCHFPDKTSAAPHTGCEAELLHPHKMFPSGGATPSTTTTTGSSTITKNSTTSMMNQGLNLNQTNHNNAGSTAAATAVGATNVSQQQQQQRRSPPQSNTAGTGTGTGTGGPLLFNGAASGATPFPRVTPPLQHPGAPRGAAGMFQQQQQTNMMNNNTAAPSTMMNPSVPPQHSEVQQFAQKAAMMTHKMSKSEHSRKLIDRFLKRTQRRNCIGKELQRSRMQVRKLIMDDLKFTKHQLLLNNNTQEGPNVNNANGFQPQQHQRRHSLTNMMPNGAANNCSNPMPNQNMYFQQQQQQRMFMMQQQMRMQQQHQASLSDPNLPQHSSQMMMKMMLMTQQQQQRQFQRSPQSPAASVGSHNTSAARSLGSQNSNNNGSGRNLVVGQHNNNSGRNLLVGHNNNNSARSLVGPNNNGGGPPSSAGSANTNTNYEEQLRMLKQQEQIVEQQQQMVQERFNALMTMQQQQSQNPQNQQHQPPFQQRRNSSVA